MRRLLTKRSARWAERVFVAEGAEVVRTGLDAGSVPEALYIAAEGAASDDVAVLADRVAALGVRVYELAPGVMARVADTVTPQPLLAVFPMTDATAVPPAGGHGAAASGAGQPRTHGEGRLVVFMADVRDPGNAGTILRTADAAGVDAVLAASGTVDPYNPKTVRSSAGSIFHVPLVVVADAGDGLEAVAQAGYRRLGTSAHEGDDYIAIDWNVPTALVLGNESGGLPATLPLDGLVQIPMMGHAESLNVGMACAVLCFEALRQHRSTMPR